MCENENMLIEKEKRNSFRLLNGMALHYLNNLMSGLYGMAQLAQMTQKEEHLVEAVDMTVKNIKKAKNLTAMMAQYSEAFGGDMHETDIGILVSSVLVLMEHDFEKHGIAIVKDIPDENGSMSVKAASGDIAEMLFRIINNALKNMSEKGGTLSIALEKQENSILIKITDTGSSAPDKMPGVSEIGNPRDGKDEQNSEWENIIVARHLALINNGDFNISANNGNGIEIEIVFKG